MMGSLVKEDLSVSFEELEDPRVDRTKKYPLEEIIFLAIFGALLGIESWRGLELLGEERLDFLQLFFPFTNGIPSHQTIGRVFSLLKPKSFEQFFIGWAKSLAGSNEGKQIAFDGKTLRGSFDKGAGKKALHILNAVAVENGITLGQLEVDGKTNEITTLPEMIESIDIKGAIVSVDALNTQKSIAEKIIDAGADYTLALKDNHKSLKEDVDFLFDTKQLNLSAEADRYKEYVEKSNGRITTREYSVIDIDDNLLAQSKDWKGLKAVGRVVTRTLKCNEESLETRIYLLSYVSVSRFSSSARGHWGVEVLHWMLDVTFGEDASRKRKDNAPRNYSLIRKFALNMIKQVKGKLSVPLAHIKASANSEYLKLTLTKAGFKLPLSSKI